MPYRQYPIGRVLCLEYNIFPLASSLFVYLCKCLCLLCIVVYMTNYALDIVLFAVNGLWSCLIDNILLGVYYVRNIIFSPLASSLFLYLCTWLCLLCIVVYMPNFALDIVVFAVNGLWSCLIDNIILGVYYVWNIKKISVTIITFFVLM